MTEPVQRMIKAATSTRLLLFAAVACTGVALAGTGRESKVRPHRAPPTVAPAVNRNVVLGLTDACAPTGTAVAKGTTSFQHGELGGALSSAAILSHGNGEIFLSIDVTTRPADASFERAPVDMALVIDRSGSMSGDKIQSARRAARGIVERLTERDRVALIQYDDTADVVVPLVSVDERGRRRLLTAIDRVVDRGGTNLGAGLQLGRDQLRRGGENRINRVILLSDGQANQGITDPTQLGEIARRAADAGIRISAVGMGLDYNEDLMETLAEHGRGRYHYVRDAADLDAVFAAELGALTSTVAANTVLHLEPSCDGVRIDDVFGYEYRREGNAVVVAMPDLFSGDQRRLLARLQVPTDRVGSRNLVRARLTYSDARTGAPVQAAMALGVQISGDAAIVEASVDRDVMGAVLEVQSAVAIKQAAKAYEQGDRNGAQAALKAQERNINEAQARYDLPTAQVQGILGGVAAFEDDVAQYDARSMEGKHALKMRKSSARSQLKHRME